MKGGMMNKKAITILVLLAVLALPMAAMAATEFSLGGYVKMEVIWDSTQVNKNLLAFISRNHAANNARIGLRHAFFKLNWPETELLMGAYWSVLTEEVPETANFGACTTAGQPFLREPQIRLTQTAGIGGGHLTASLALAAVENGLWGLAINANPP